MYIGKMLCHLTFFSPVWVFYVLRLVASEVAYSQWLHLYDFSMLFDNVFPKIVCLRSATFPISSFKWFLFAVYGHSPCWIIWFVRCWIIWFVRDIFTLITFMRFYLKRFSLYCVFLMQVAWCNMLGQMLHLTSFSPGCIFICTFSVFAWETKYSHLLHFCDFSPLCAITWLLTTSACKEA